MEKTKSSMSPVVVWVILVCISTIAFLLVEQFAGIGIGAMVTVAIVVAYIKVHLILTEFIELKMNVMPQRIIFGVWAAIVLATLLIGYWAPVLA